MWSVARSIVSTTLLSTRRERRRTAMRVVVNRTLCESNAVCARLVPEIFVVDDDDDRLQIKQEQPPGGLRERVEHAVRRCPKLALSIVEDRGKKTLRSSFDQRPPPRRTFCCRVSRDSTGLG